MFRFLKLGFLALLAISSVSVEAKKKQPPLTPMELQAIQSKEFETTKEEAFSAVMTVFQDLGYQIESADLATGFITANSPTQNKTGFFEAWAGMQSSGNTKATAYVQNMPSKLVKIRLNFLNTRITSSAYGRSGQEDKPILAAAPYVAAWEKIDEALFVSSALNDKPTKENESTTEAAPTPPQ